MARRYESKVAIIGMGRRDNLSRLEDFVEDHDFDVFPHVADESGELRSRLGVVGQPTWIFIAADGSVEKVFGQLGEDNLVRRLDALVAA